MCLLSISEIAIHLGEDFVKFTSRPNEGLFISFYISMFILTALNLLNPLLKSCGSTQKCKFLQEIAPN